MRELSGIDNHASDDARIRGARQILQMHTQPHASDPLFASPAASANGLIYISVGDAALCFEDP